MKFIIMEDLKTCHINNITTIATHDADLYHGRPFDAVVEIPFAANIIGVAADAVSSFCCQFYRY